MWFREVPCEAGFPQLPLGKKAVSGIGLDSQSLPNLKATLSPNTARTRYIASPKAALPLVPVAIHGAIGFRLLSLGSEGIEHIPNNSQLALPALVVPPSP